MATVYKASSPMNFDARLRLARKRDLINGARLKAAADESDVLAARYAFLRGVVLNAPCNAIPQAALTEAAEVVQRLCALANQFRSLLHETKRLHAEKAELHGQLQRMIARG